MKKIGSSLVVNLFVVLSIIEASAQQKITNLSNLSERKEDKPKKFSADTTTAFNLKSQYDNIAEKKIVETKKRKKRKPKMYANVRVKRGVIRKISGSTITVEFFHVAKKQQLLPQDKFLREIYYYNPKKKTIQYGDYHLVTNKIKGGEKWVLLHGAYQKIVNNELREEGFFNHGAKDGIWEEYEPYQGEMVLKEKIKYNKGWYAEAQITYFDEAEGKIKEIIPILHNQKNGKYILYYENGNIAKEGYYQYDVPVGIWREYYPNQKRKKEIKYPNNFYEAIQPYILREWNEKGELIYDIDKDGGK
ncbi:MAG: hypothetical protein NZ551_05655 [Microscillaceae bacterium]|nr:hypothetical protein [Microscillaceae bacterium]MDW8460682.1 hypothetical protein [Cytophagales bacterium]